MSDLALARGAEGEGAFRPRTVLIALAIGIGGFVAMLLFAAEAPPSPAGGDSGGHALSRGAIGFAAIVELVGASGARATIARDETALRSEDLLVVTPPADTNENKDLTKLLAARGPRPTLIVLPKWAVLPDPLRRGWVTLAEDQSTWLAPSNALEGSLVSVGRVTVHHYRGGGRRLVATGEEGFPDLRVDAPRALQTAAGATLVPLLTDAAGHAVLARVGDSHVYLLADPDLLANWRLARLDRATAAVRLLAALNSTGARTTGFDVTLNGFGRSPSLLRLAFEPPILALTLTLAAALLLVGIQAFGRFGPARRRERALAFGKAALLDNTAGVVRMARREVAFGPRYAAAVRAQLGRALGAPASLGPDALEDWLDRGGEGARVGDLVRRVIEARDKDALVVAARALRIWGKTG